MALYVPELMQSRLPAKLKKVRYFVRLITVFCYQNYFDLLWEKNCSSDQKTFKIRGWRPRNFGIILRSLKLSIQIVSEQVLEAECIFNLFLEVSQIEWIRTIKILIGENCWDLEAYRKSQKTFFSILRLFCPTYTV